ncbi:Lateral signaling target protein 2 [Phlyctochytrium planicorne]|nr:Lateral signaling target protein 2 [Phlyctochytrium planicorne]
MAYHQTRAAFQQPPPEQAPTPSQDQAAAAQQAAPPPPPAATQTPTQNQQRPQRSRSRRLPTPNASGAAPAPQNTFSIAQIFHFKKWKPLAGEVCPRLNESQPLTLYYYADENLTQAIKALKRIRNTTSDSFRRKSERVHRAQRLLLDTIHLIYSDLDDELKANRDYRRQLPPEDQRELENGFSENILFAAQALSKGFRIRGIEHFTTDLVQPARELCASVEALRYLFRLRSLTCPAANYDDLFEVMGDFDKNWTIFEKKICFCYFSVTYAGRPSQVDETDMFQVLMSETILRAIGNNLIKVDQLHAFDPTIIVSVPRMSILNGLIHMPEIVNMTDPERSFRWFRAKSYHLQEVQQNLKALSCDGMTYLEHLIADVEADDFDESGFSTKAPGQGSLEVYRSKLSKEELDTIGNLYREICSVADEIARYREFVTILQSVFRMHCP